MAYLPNIPAAADQISVSQGQIQGNFQAINAGFNQNHVSLNAALGTAGQHSFVQLQPQAPTPAFAGIPGFWSSTAAGNPIFLHTAAGVDVNISAKTFTNNATGSSFLPSGLLLKFGRGTTAGGGAIANINLDAILPHYNAACIPFILIAPEETGAFDYRWAQLRPGWTSANFSVNTGNFVGAPAIGSFQWFAIGIV